ncbi:hypothetical protein KOR34_40200 [Posidoniimonas corsicana]|uniref:Uncharacterized protein n=1 Tax=Posidoniimonas corsicana TaxID=1938618 RepID=A0A5C5V1B3_9BACT|nr:hypothetical protein [Posidoniimonas corsicana]TWT32258.1 hypothetical protein KOR34_40200 [Posidoniimonas corsicana]
MPKDIRKQCAKTQLHTPEDPHLQQLHVIGVTSIDIGAMTLIRHSHGMIT